MLSSSLSPDEARLVLLDLPRTATKDPLHRANMAVGQKRRRPATAARSAASSSWTDGRLYLGLLLLLGRLPLAMSDTVSSVTESEFSQCKLYLFVSDSDRNNQLIPQEFVAFVNRLTINAFLGESFLDLPPVIRDVFVLASGTNTYVSTVGARPGQSASPAQIYFLRDFCDSSYNATRIWEEMETMSPTSAPTQVPGPGPGPNQGPTISASEFSFCTTSLAVSDRNLNTLLDQEEYVTFLNRFVGNLYLGQTFSSIDPVFQQHFQGLRDTSGSIAITGSRSGAPRTAEQNTHLLLVCSETYRVVSTFSTMAPTHQATSNPTIAPSIAPTGPTTSQPSQSLSAIEFLQCQASLSTSDADLDSAIGPSEYVNFLNLVSEDAFAGYAFSTLDASFLQVFNAFQTDTGRVSILGSKPGDSPSSEQAASLRLFCSSVFTNLDSIDTQPPTSSPSFGDPFDDPIVLSCSWTLAVVDTDGNNMLSRDEYARYITEASTGSDISNGEFASLPYILRDNFLWIAGDAGMLDLGDIQQRNETRLSQIARVCRRTDMVVDSVLTGNTASTLTGHCYASFTAADTNLDGVLNESEFTRLVAFFQGLRPTISTLELLDPVYQDFFDTNKGPSSGLINIEGSKPGDDPNPGQELSLSYLCGELARAAETARGRFLSLITCTDSLGDANRNADNFLSEDEYLDFVSTLAGRPIGSNVFGSIPEELLLNYQNLTSPTGFGIYIEGWRAVESFGEQREKLEMICASTQAAILSSFGPLTPTSAPTVLEEPVVVTIYNGFVLGSADGLTAVDLRNSDISDLDDAYRLFVDAIVSPLIPNGRLRGRRLSVVDLKLTSSTVYLILDVTCSTSLTNSSKSCLEAYASFDLVVTSNTDVTNTQDEYSSLTQGAIAVGDLQSQLDWVSPNSSLNVVGVTESVVPGGSSSPVVSPPEPTGAPTSPPIERGAESSGSSILEVFVAILAVAAAVAACFGGWMYYQRRRRRTSDDASQEGSLHKREDAGTAMDELNLEDSDPNIHVAGFKESTSHNGDPLVAEAASIHYRPPSEEAKTSPSSNSKDKFTMGVSANNSTTTKQGGWDRGPGAASTSDSGSDGSGLADGGFHGDTGFATSFPSGGGPGDSSVSRGSVNTRNTRQSSSTGGSQGEGRQIDGTPPNDPFDSEQFQTEHFRDSDTSEGDTSEGDFDQSPGGMNSFDYGSSTHDEAFFESEDEPSNSNEVYEDEPPEGEDDYYDGDDFDESAMDDIQEESESAAEDDTLAESCLSTRSTDRRQLEQYRIRIESLVRRVVPDEVDNVDQMMEQFEGRLPALIETLTNMAQNAGGDDSVLGEDLGEDLFEEESYYSDEDHGALGSYGSSYDSEGFEDEVHSR